MRAFLAVLLLTALSVAGCLADPGTDDLDAPAATDPFTAAAGDLPVLDWDVGAAVDFWEAFVDGTKRDAYAPDTPLTSNAASRDQLAAELEAAGFDVEVRTYEGGALGASVPAGVQSHAVVAVWPGAVPERIGLIAHYDTQSGTIEGAYDNGSGTVAVVETCKALAAGGALEHTLACILFDAEEVGAVGSRAYVADEVATGEAVYDLVLGFDMVGINWPGHDWKLYHFVGGEFAETLHPFTERVMRDVLAYPEEGNEVFDFNDRNSDEASFAAAGVPTVRFAGGRTAGDYPQYHMPDDTPEFVYDHVGGRENFEAGFGAVVESAYTLASMFDAAGPDA